MRAAMQGGLGGKDGEVGDIWKALDKMVETDPGAYEAFIGSQRRKMDSVAQDVRQVKEFVPEPAFVIEAVLEDDPGPVAAARAADLFIADFYVNVCSSDRVRPPCPDNSTEIVVSVGTRRNDPQHGKTGRRRIVIDAVVATSVVQRCRSDSGFKRSVADEVLRQVLALESKERQWGQSSQRNGQKEIKVHDDSSRGVRCQPGSIQLPKLLYKAGKHPQPHVLRPHADPACADAAAIHEEGSEGGRGPQSELRLPTRGDSQPVPAPSSLIEEVPFPRPSPSPSSLIEEVSSTTCAAAAEEGLISQASPKMVDEDGGAGRGAISGAAAVASSSSSSSAAVVAAPASAAAAAAPPPAWIEEVRLQGPTQPSDDSAAADALGHQELRLHLKFAEGISPADLDVEASAETVRIRRIGADGQPPFEIALPQLVHPETAAKWKKKLRTLVLTLRCI